ncbi:MarR family winged helix-turn-helix transcriptional regulator [Actinacidiphila acididurans]|uniref:MarR family transcriptional regulator n=1 Tax=Actinacidiphila acididurans TaxID=2784346 RepID=A0ABS2TVU2_9ACTN|nr:MarR family transcriptional regulator [Actinacidiphila acididurans]MBM9507091.1 MarR family transcriptional regulator [Actinacidiphila acididurans]
MARSGTAEQAGAQAPLTPRADFPLAGRSGYLLHKAALLLLEDVEQALDGIGMRSRYFFVLASLAGGPDLSQQDLSRLLSLDPTTVVALVDEMERNQHVERRRNPADRRRYNLILTESGREALAEADRVVTEAESAFFGGLADDEREALRGMLGRLMEGRWPASVCTA